MAKFGTGSDWPWMIFKQWILSMGRYGTHLKNNGTVKKSSCYYRHVLEQLECKELCLKWKIKHKWIGASKGDNYTCEKMRCIISNVY